MFAMAIMMNTPSIPLLILRRLLPLHIAAGKFVTVFRQVASSLFDLFSFILCVDSSARQHIPSYDCCNCVMVGTERAGSDSRKTNKLPNSLFATEAAA